MDWWTCLIWWTYRHAWHQWCDTDLVFSLKLSPEQCINASFLYVFHHCDDNDNNDDNDGDGDDGDDDGDDDDDDSDGADDGVSNDNDSENGDFSDENIVWQK